MVKKKRLFETQETIGGRATEIDTEEEKETLRKLREQTEKTKRERAAQTETQLPEKPKEKAFGFQEFDEGRNVAVTTPEGESFFISRRDIETFKQQAAERNIPIKSGEEIEFQRQTQEVIQQRQEKALQLFSEFRGQPLSPEIQASLTPEDINLYSALTSVLGGGVAGAGIKAGAGALGVGAAATGGGLAVAAGVVGAGASIANIRSQVQDIITGKNKAANKHIQQLDEAINSINQGGNPIDAALVFGESRSQILQLRAELKLQEETFLAKGTGKDATKELIILDNYIETILPRQETEFEIAILNPNPTKIKNTAPLETPEE